MKTLKKGELFRSVKKHLEANGVILEKGEASDKLRAGCALLTAVATKGQSSFQTAKNAVTEQIDNLRQTIHDKTAPTAKPVSKKK